MAEETDPRAELGRPEKFNEACRSVRRVVMELERFCSKHEICLALNYGHKLARGEVSPDDAYGPDVDYG